MLMDDNYKGSEPKLDEHQMSDLEYYLEEHILPDAKSVIAHIEKRAFLEQYEQIKANKEENDPVYFADATHPQHNSIPSYGWIKKGQEKELKTNCGRQRLNINGAINRKQYIY